MAKNEFVKKIVKMYFLGDKIMTKWLHSKFEKKREHALS